MNRRREDRWATAIFCAVFLLWLTVWGVIIFVAAHFILKYW